MLVTQCSGFPNEDFLYSSPLKKAVPALPVPQQERCLGDSTPLGASSVWWGGQPRQCKPMPFSVLCLQVHLLYQALATV